MNKWTIGMVGLGAAAKSIHLPAIGKIGRLNIVGGVDAAAKKNAFPFPIFDSLSDLMGSQSPNIIAIATPPNSHFSLICQSLNAGAHVFCEKPFVASIEEGRKIVELSKARKRAVVVNNEFRFMNVHSAAKKQINSPKFGALLFISINQTFFVTEQTEAGWRGQSNKRTCFEFGTHALDLCRFFFDEEPVSISARMPKPGKPEGPDYLNLIQLEFSGDRFAHITLDRLSRGPHRYLDIRLDGTEGCIESKLGGLAELAVGVKGGTRKPFMRVEISPSASARIYQAGKEKSLATDPIDLFPNATANLLGEMLNALEAGAEPPCSAADNLHTLAMMLAAYESAERGGTAINLKTYMADNQDG
jgi:D-apiose dehydrogenase